MVKGTYVDKNGVRKGAWTQEEDAKLRAYVERFGHSNWKWLPKLAGLDRCGKGCRLRWMNHLKPGLKRGDYTQEERDLIAKLHRQHGNKWSAIAAELPGRTDHAIKNYWHAHYKKSSSADESSDSKLCNHIESRLSSSQVVLESSELGSDSSTDNISSINAEDLVVSGFDDTFWSQPFVDSYDFRVCDGEPGFSYTL